VHAIREDDSPALATIADVSSVTARKLHIVNLTPVNHIDGTESQNSVEARRPSVGAWNFDHVNGGRRAVPRRVKARQLAIDDKFFNLDHVSEGKRAVARRIDTRAPDIPGIAPIDDKFFNLDHVSEGKRAVARQIDTREPDISGIAPIDDKFFNLDHVSEGKREELKGRPLISVDKSFDLDHVYGGKRAAARVVSED
jgi:hypothetical protein